MKQIYLAFSVLLFSKSITAQNVPVTGGLVAHFDNAAANYTITNNLAVWTDNISGITAKMTDVSMMPNKITVNGHTGLEFNNFEYLATEIISDFSSVTPTIIVVKRGQIVDDIYRTVASLSKGGAVQEFFLGDITAHYHYSTGNFNYKTHQCATDVQRRSFSVTAAAFSTDNFSFDYYLNGVKSTEAINSYGTSFTNSITSRMLGIGYRVNWYVNDKYDGEIYEVLVYNRKLTDTEMETVTEYLVCKYDIDEEFCRADLFCEKTEDPNSINTVSISEHFDVYPNPTSSQLNIQSKANAKFEVTLFDMVGRAYQTQTYNTTAVVNVKHLPLGTYLIKVGSEDLGYFWKKITKN